MKTFKQLIKLASQPLKSLKETKLDLSKSSEKQTHQHKVEDTSIIKQEKFEVYYVKDVILESEI